MRYIGAIPLMIFYAVYFGKLLLQKQRGIQTDQIAKGKDRGKEYCIEAVMKAATYLVVAVEAACIFFAETVSCLFWWGLGTALAGTAVFTVSVVIMRDNWRAGIAKKDPTELVTTGIYQISRNPAFLGFDLVYIGLLMMYFNWFLLAATLFAAVMLHLQILQEEKYLRGAFGEPYRVYQKRVCRYLGVKPVRKDR